MELSRMYFVFLITTNAFLVSLPSVASSSHSIVDQAAQALAINQAKLSSAALKLFIDQLIASGQPAVSIKLPPTNTFPGLTDKGIFTLPSGGTIDLGRVNVPFGFTCAQSQSSFVYKLFCHLCTLDCLYVHNKFGGKCGTVQNPIPGTPQATGQECVCNDNNPFNRQFTQADAVGLCDKVLDNDKDAEALDAVLVFILKFREKTDLCFTQPGKNPVDVGCCKDCRNNHQYRSGTCEYLSPIVPYPGDKNPTVVCNCKYQDTACPSS